MSRAILVLNAGSSSLKFRVFGGTDALPLLANGRITGIGAQPEFSVDGVRIKSLPATLTQQDALGEIMAWLSARETAWQIGVIGHRIVHGGADIAEPTLLNDAVLRVLDGLVPLAPLHQPHALSAVRTLRTLYPQAQQIGCFDTAFHAAHAPVFRQYAVPQSLRDQGVHRYGFHGLSYEWVAQVLASAHSHLAKGRVVAAHLGNGASLCALHAGKSIDTTMGMTALDGLPMGTRCGSIDPGVTLYMMRQLGMDADAIDHLLSHESGLKGLSGISGDMQVLAASDRPEAAFAIDFFTMMTAQHVARMAVALGGMDALVFTGGIGEHHAAVRDAIVARLAFLPAFETVIIGADEERMIAQHCLTIMKGRQ